MNDETKINKSLEFVKRDFAYKSAICFYCLTFQKGVTSITIFFKFIMPEIKIKHVVSFSSEDKVHKAENLLKAETYRKWKCATPGEKNATVVLQFEKAMKIHSIDIGNESSAFVEVLVGRSSDSVSDYQVLLVASSFMSPLECRNGTHANRVRMFGPEKLSQNVKDEKWDCVQIVCTQPFNKNVTYGLTFIKFHSPPEKIEEQPNSSAEKKSVTKLGAFKLKDDDDDDDSLPSIGSWFGKQKTNVSESSLGPSTDQAGPSYASAVLASSSSASKVYSQDNSLKRKIAESSDVSQDPPSKKTSLNKEHIVYKDVLRDSPEKKQMSVTNRDVKKDALSPKVGEKKKEPASTPFSSKHSANNTVAKPSKQNVQFNKLMEKVVFVLSGFVNPLRSELRDKALEMGAKYKPDWDASCTHLVCAFAKTPKFEQVTKVNGRIVTKEWILDCYKKKQPLLWRRYELSADSSSSSSSPEEIDDSDADPDYADDIFDQYDDKKKKRKKTPETQNKKVKADNSASKKKPQSPVAKNTGISSNSSFSSTPTRKKYNLSDSDDEPSASKKKSNFSIFNKQKMSQEKNASDDSESLMVTNADDEIVTTDEEALQDYIADTDVEDDSGGDTEDEIMKVEAKAQKKKAKLNGVNREMEVPEKPDVSDLPLPELPDFFKKRHFFLYGDFRSSNLHKLQRYITAYNGVIEDYMSDQVKYVITENKWDSNFDDALGANEDLIFVKPTWIFKCHESGKLMPYQPHIVIPDT